MSKKVVIMRGVPGSGKSTRAREAAENFCQDNFSVTEENGVISYIKENSVAANIHSTDNFFMKNGAYVFNRFKLGENHNKNFNAFKNSVSQNIALVIVDNTNVKKREYKRYFDYAIKNGYEVEVISILHPEPEVAFRRNTHGVPLDVIKRMINSFEE